MEAENMRESPLYQEILEEGGQARSRAHILQALKVRFGADAPAEVAEALNGITDSELLSELFTKAIKCRSIGAFRRALDGLQA